jgi:hypothetical protein
VSDQIIKRVSALGNLDDDVDISRTWETNAAYVRISVIESQDYYELKHHEIMFD